MRRLTLLALALAAFSGDASAVPQGFTRPPSKLFLTCPTGPQNFDQRALSERNA